MAEMQSLYNEEEDLSRITQPELRKRVQNRLSQRRHRAKIRQEREPLSREIAVPPPSSSALSPIIGNPNFEPSPTGIFDFSAPEKGGSALSAKKQDDFDSMIHQGLIDTVGANMCNGITHVPDDDMIIKTGTELGFPSSEMTPSYPPQSPITSCMGASSSNATSSPDQFWANGAMDGLQWTVPGLQTSTSLGQIPTSHVSSDTCTMVFVNDLFTQHASKSPSQYMKRSVSDPEEPESRLELRGPTSKKVGSTSQSNPTQERVDRQGCSVSSRRRARTYADEDSGVSDLSHKDDVEKEPCEHCGTSRRRTESWSRAAGPRRGSLHASATSAPGRLRANSPSVERHASPKSSSDEMEILAHCSKALAKMAQQEHDEGLSAPGCPALPISSKDERSRRGSRHARKASRSIGSKASASSSSTSIQHCQQNTSHDDEVRSDHSRDEINKVVILYVKNNRSGKVLRSKRS